MTRLLMSFLLLPACLGLSNSAWAAWGKFIFASSAEHGPRPAGAVTAPWAARSTTTPDVRSHTAGLLVCGATAVTDNAFYANVWGGSSWSGWSKIGGSATGSPACAPLG